MNVGGQQMTAREFARKVWQYKRLPPLWMWNPTWLRRLIVALAVPPWWLLGTVLWMVVASIAWLVQELPEAVKAEAAHIRKVWRGERPDGF